MRLMPLKLARRLVKRDRERRSFAEWPRSRSTARALARRNVAAMKSELLAAVPLFTVIKRTLDKQDSMEPSADDVRKETLRQDLLPAAQLGLVTLAIAEPVASGVGFAVNAAINLVSAAADGLQAAAWDTLAEAEEDQPTDWK